MSLLLAMLIGCGCGSAATLEPLPSEASVPAEVSQQELSICQHVTVQASCTPIERLERQMLQLCPSPMVLVRASINGSAQCESGEATEVEFQCCAEANPG